MNHTPHHKVASPRDAVTITAWVALFWLLATLPAYRWGDTPGLEALSCAALLCAVPGALVFLIGSRYRAASNPLLLALGAMGLRMFAALGGLLVVREVRPDLPRWQFTGWLVAFYLATLLVETLLVVRRVQKSGNGIERADA